MYHKRSNYANNILFPLKVFLTLLIYKFWQLLIKNIYVMTINKSQIKFTRAINNEEVQLLTSSFTLLGYVCHVFIMYLSTNMFFCYGLTNLRYVVLSLSSRGAQHELRIGEGELGNVLLHVRDWKIVAHRVGFLVHAFSPVSKWLRRGYHAHHAQCGGGSGGKHGLHAA